MLRTISGLSRPVSKWLSQVTASLGATLAATLIWSAAPHSAAQPAPQPELTSGGKFAARAVGPVAYDGLDAMPLPHVAPPPARFLAVPTEAVPAALPHRVSWNEASTPVPEPERVTRAARPARPRAEARRDAAPALRAASGAAALPSEPAPEPADDENLLHRVMPSALPRLLPAVMATARNAWTATTLAGGMLVAQVVPQVP